MRILHVVSYYDPHIGGIEQVAKDCVNALRGVAEQRVICFNHEKGDANGEVGGVGVLRAGCFAKISSQSLSFSYPRLLKRTMKEFSPDVVIFHYPNPFLAHFLLPALKKRRNCKLILYWHLDITRQKILGKFFKGQTERLLRRAEVVVATSPNYIDGSPFLATVREKCRVIPNCANLLHTKTDAADRARAEELRTVYAGKIVLFAFGRHVPYKGMEYLVRASKLLDDRFVVLIGGEGPLTHSLRELAQDDPKVVFTGRLSDEDLRAHLLASDIFCFPSITKNEAFGIALAEAMMYGKPCVTFTIEGSGVNYVSLRGVTGEEAENGNVEEFAEAIVRLADHPKLREQYGEAAKERAEKLFSPEHFSERIRRLVGEAAGAAKE